MIKNLDQIISTTKRESSYFEEQTQNVEFSNEQKGAILKAVFYVISADNIVTKEEKDFFLKLCLDLKVDENIIKEIAINMTDDDMFKYLNEVSDNQESYVMQCLSAAAMADNELAPEELNLLDIFKTNIPSGERPKSFFEKILTF